MLETEVNPSHLRVIRRLHALSSEMGLPVWIGGGWGVDARLGYETRVHDDIDLTYPQDREDDFQDVLVRLGARVTQQTDYGFLAITDGVLLDCEAARLDEGRYELDESPPGSCPPTPEGMIGGVHVHCNSWETMLWDYLYYEREVSSSDWPEKHQYSYSIVVSVLGDANVSSLRKRFDALYPL